MSEKKGWVKNHRKSLDNPIICKDADHFAVWNYLLLMATHSEYDTMFGKKRITLKAGQMIVGRKMISSKFKISESKVQRILKTFESEHQIEQHINKYTGRLVTILNWDKYQENEHHVNEVFTKKSSVKTITPKSEHHVNNANQVTDYDNKGLDFKSEHHVNIIRTSCEHHVNTKQEDKEYKELKNVRMIDAEKFIKKWNENFKEKINQSKFNQSINQLSNYSSEEIFSVLDKATKSNYLLGLTEKNKRGMTLYFFTNPKNFEKIKNQNYRNYQVKNKNKVSIAEEENRMSKAERLAFIEKRLKQKLPIKIKNKEK